jgi:hypothetical protein
MLGLISRREMFRAWRVGRLRSKLLMLDIHTYPILFDEILTWLHRGKRKAKKTAAARGVEVDVEARDVEEIEERDLEGLEVREPKK